MLLTRTRWSAIGAAVAVSLGAGGVGLVTASLGTGERAVYTAIEPCRLLDTRPNQGIGGRTTPLEPGEIATIDLQNTRDDCDAVPTDVVAVGLNVTAVFASELTDLRFWADGAHPNAANLNPAPGQPPTPNAVTTDVTSAGTFQVRNTAGTVHLIVDLVGIYQNHHHNDRYYTKTQADARYQPFEPWSIDISPSDMWSFDGGPYYTLVNDSRIGASGMRFGETSNCCSVTVGFRLPGGYRGGDQVVLDIDWMPAYSSQNWVGCSFAFVSYYPRVSRVGASMFTTPTSWADGSPRFVVTDDGLNRGVVSDKQLELDSSDLQPGDRVHLQLHRTPDSVDDSCLGIVSIQGITVHAD